MPIRMECRSCESMTNRESDIYVRPQLGFAHPLWYCMKPDRCGLDPTGDERPPHPRDARQPSCLRRSAVLNETPNPGDSSVQCSPPSPPLPYLKRCPAAQGSCGCKIHCKRSQPRSFGINEVNGKNNSKTSKQSAATEKPRAEKPI